MAPTTHIGAAHPVLVGDDGPAKRLIRRIRPEPAAEDDRSGAADDPMSQKILNDAVAWITGIARTRHRNETWARRAVTDSFSVSSDEAVNERIVDLVASDLTQLLEKIDGWPIDTAAGTKTLATASASIQRFPMTARQQFLAVVTNPSIAYLLMLLGTLGLVVEFTHPGIGFPGIGGAICLILAMYAFQTLPISYAGVALIALGLLLLIAEVKVTSFGLLALGGAIALTLGSLMLFEVPASINLSLRIILPVVLGVSAIVLFLVNLAVRALRRPVTTGAEGLLGQRGTAETDLSPSGRVFVTGELWSAVSETPLPRGEVIIVTGRDGMTLRVKPAAGQARHTEDH
jgi:membrane-bound serine protease (ClpP class)